MLSMRPASRKPLGFSPPLFRMYPTIRRDLARLGQLDHAHRRRVENVAITRNERAQRASIRRFRPHSKSRRDRRKTCPRLAAPASTAGAVLAGWTVEWPCTSAALVL